jgi:CrcB protein
VEKLVWLALAGGLGALSRYGLAGLVHRLYGGSFPLGTFMVNVTGCLLFGLIWGLFDVRLAVPPTVRAAVLVGFMGAFTTFSTYMFEGADLLRQGQWAWAPAYLGGQIPAGLAGLTLAWPRPGPSESIPMELPPATRRASFRLHRRKRRARRPTPLRVCWWRSSPPQGLAGCRPRPARPHRLRRNSQVHTFPVLRLSEGPAHQGGDHRHTPKRSTPFGRLARRGAQGGPGCAAKRSVVVSNRHNGGKK